jgi:translation initiation factor 2 subunit 2
MTKKERLPDYEAMLDAAYSEIPFDVSGHARFEIPELQHDVIGRRGPTILYNFKEICDTINRKPSIVLKFLAKELGTPGTRAGSRVSFKGRFDRGTFVRLLDRFVREYVICPECKLPDTRIVKEKRLRFLKCDACGAKSPAKAI